MPGLDTPVSVSVGGGTAAASDFRGAGAGGAVDNFVITIPAGSTSGKASFRLEALDDTLFEGSEFINLSGSSAGLTVFGEELFILDGDSKIALTVDPGSVTEGAAAAEITVTATLTGFGGASQPTAPTAALSVPVSVVAGTAAVGDFTPVDDFAITIPAGSTSGTGTFRLETVDDVLREGEEIISVTGPATGATASGGRLGVSPAELRVVDNEQWVRIVLPSGSFVREGQTFQRFITGGLVGFGGPGQPAFPQTTQVQLSVADSADVHGWSDSIQYFGVSRRFAIGSEVQIRAKQDELFEGPEVVTVTGTARIPATGMSVVVEPVEVALVDRESRVELSVSPAQTVREGGGAVRVAVSATLVGFGGPGPAGAAGGGYGGAGVGHQRFGDGVPRFRDGEPLHGYHSGRQDGGERNL